MFTVQDSSDSGYIFKLAIVDFNVYRKGYMMLSMYGILLTEIVLGVALMMLLFASNVTAEMRSDSSSQSNSELQSDRSKTQTQPGQTDLTSTTGQSSELPSRYAVMPVARGQKIDVENSLIGDTVTNSKGEPLGRLERLINDSETQTLRTSEPRRAGKGARSNEESGGPMGENKASGSGPSGPIAGPPSSK